jgi:predicted DNA-binding ribbon-helix-helix protein
MPSILTVSTLQQPLWRMVRANQFTSIGSAQAVMKSLVVKRSVVIAGHKTSVSLEDAFWKTFKEIADQRSVTASELAAAVDAERRHPNLSSAIRLFVLGYYRDQLSEYERRDRTRGTPANTILGPSWVTVE